MGHPLFLNRISILYYIFVWSILAMLQIVVLRYRLAFGWTEVTSDSLLSAFLFGFIAITFWYQCRYNSLESANILRVLINHALAAALTAAIWLGLIYYFLSRILATSETYLTFLEASLPWRYFIGVLLYFVVVAFYYLLIYYQSFHEKLVRESELKSLVKEAELKTLKFQINPHFIFNSLNSINSLILTMPENASEMTVKLADFLRSTLSSNDVPKKPFQDELRTAKLYLDIEKTRFGDKIIYHETIDEAALGIPVPSMILQPIFENAVKYGVYESLAPVNIRLTTRLKNNTLNIVIENDFDPENITGKGEGVGLKNIKSRLELMYGRPKLLSTTVAESLFRVAINIPLEDE